MGHIFACQVVLEQKLNHCDFKLLNTERYLKEFWTKFSYLNQYDSSESESSESLKK